ncbi:MAG: transposase zinc-binding domain-containing protein [Deltaproteobacteria bacterium]|nr:transposase zinc-binding domain-containing protein [Deltaproteobacteria bacterium]
MAFSCKRRRVCSSCGGRRMSETAARQCDRVLPAVPYRQWDSRCRGSCGCRWPVIRRCSTVSRCSSRCASGYVRRRQGRRQAGSKEGAAVAAICAEIRWESMDLSPHLHVLVADRLFVCREDGARRVHGDASADER